MRLFKYNQQVPACRPCSTPNHPVYNFSFCSNTTPFLALCEEGLILKCIEHQHPYQEEKNNVLILLTETVIKS